jgi:hypothetical protein
MRDPVTTIAVSSAGASTGVAAGVAVVAAASAKVADGLGVEAEVLANAGMLTKARPITSGAVPAFNAMTVLFFNDLALFCYPRISG